MLWSEAKYSQTPTRVDNAIGYWIVAWIAQLVERSYVKRETLGSTLGSGLYFLLYVRYTINYRTTA